MKKITSLIVTISLLVGLLTVFGYATDTSLTANAYMINSEGAVYLVFNKPIASYDGITLYAQTNDGAEHVNTGFENVTKINDTVLKFTSASVGDGTLGYWKDWQGLLLNLVNSPVATDGSVLPLASYSIRNGDTGWAYSAVSAFTLPMAFMSSESEVLAVNLNATYDLTAKAYLLNSEGAIYLVFNKSVTAFDKMTVYAEIADGSNRSDIKIENVSQVGDTVLKCTSASVGDGTLAYWRDWCGLSVHIQGTAYSGNSEFQLEPHIIRNADTDWANVTVNAYNPEVIFVGVDNEEEFRNTYLRPVYDLTAKAFIVNSEGAVYFVFNKPLTSYSAVTVYAEYADGSNRYDAVLENITKVNDYVLKATGSAVGDGTFGYWNDWMAPLTIHMQNTPFAGTSELELGAHNIRNADTGWAYLPINAFTPVTAFVDADKVPTDIYSANENEVPAGCLEKGGYDEVIYCISSADDATPVELSRKRIELAAKGHTPGAVETVTEQGATGTVTKEIVKCTECQTVISEIIVGSVPDEGNILTAKAFINNSDGTVYVVFDKALTSYSGIFLWAETQDGTERFNTKFENVSKIGDKVLKFTSSAVGNGTLAYWKDWLGPLEIYLENSPSAGDSKLPLEKHSIRNGDTGWAYNPIAACKLDYSFVASEQEVLDINLNAVYDLRATACIVNPDGSIYLVFNKELTSYSGLILWVQTQDGAERFDTKFDTVTKINNKILKFTSASVGDGTLGYWNEWQGPMTLHLQSSPKSGDSELPLESHGVRNADTGWVYNPVNAYTLDFVFVDSEADVLKFNPDATYDLTAEAYIVDSEGAVYLEFNKNISSYEDLVFWVETQDGSERFDTKLDQVTKVKSNVLKFTSSAVGAGTLAYWNEWQGPMTLHLQGSPKAGDSELPLESHGVRNADTGWNYKSVNVYTPEFGFVDSSEDIVSPQTGDFLSGAVTLTGVLLIAAVFCLKKKKEY